jgi:hypothetical protein
VVVSVMLFSFRAKPRPWMLRYTLKAELTYFSHPDVLALKSVRRSFLNFSENALLSSLVIEDSAATFMILSKSKDFSAT